MAKMQKKVKRQVVSIETGREWGTAGVEGFDSELLNAQQDTHGANEWGTVLARLRCEISQIDQAIRALTQLSTGRGLSPQLVSQSDKPEPQADRKTC